MNRGCLNFLRSAILDSTRTYYDISAKGYPPACPAGKASAPVNRTNHNSSSANARWRWRNASWKRCVAERVASHLFARWLAYII